MKSDINENYFKIIETKMKLIKTEAEKYESKIRKESNTLSLIKDKIKAIKNQSENVSSEDLSQINELEEESKIIIAKIKSLKTEKFEKLGTDMQIGFRDDHYIKSEYNI